MKKNILIFFILLTIPFMGIAQDDWIIGLKEKWRVATHDTTKVLVMAEYSNYYKSRKLDSALIYGFDALSLARKINFQKGEVLAMQYIALTYFILGNDSKGFQLCLQGINLAEKNNMPLPKSFFKIVIGRIYLQSKNFKQALRSFREAKIIIDSNIEQLNVNTQLQSEGTLMNISNTFLEMDQLDSAMHYGQLAYKGAVARLNSTENWVIFPSILVMGKIESAKKNPNQALTHFRHSLYYAMGNEAFFNTHYSLAEQFKKISQQDSAVFYAESALNYAHQSGFYKYIINANLLLSDIYEAENPQNAILYLKAASAYNDSLNNLVNTTIQETITDYDEQQRQFELETARKDFRQRLRRNAFLGSTFTLIIIAIFLYINSRREKKAKQKVELAYDQLKSTQTQLIQSEKMASLGELTAGIAHEIQNPLNFVNNFSELSNELMEEIKEELAVGNVQLANEIVEDIIQNLEKINHHGKRAADIVKGMLQHSRTSTGQKEPTDINALADEYLRLSYHGLRAKDKSFNADFKTDFDPKLPKINVIPQEIGRVLLNLINNAFYAAPLTPPAGGGVKDPNYVHKPTVTISTTSSKSPSGDLGVEIRVKDNGPGIPKKILDKIFQPFFTTKPTGQGTGLGLSLSYDIVKAHGGKIKVETVEGRGTEFIIHLPI